ncbi:MAG TPA: hypothetical protein PKC59_12900, partial [Burkholderiaceae bacterium]|nr:hypothetical protein [Burkholderiaceae bacterium]
MPKWREDFDFPSGLARPAGSGVRVTGLRRGTRHEPFTSRQRIDQNGMSSSMSSKPVGDFGAG